jgi:protein SCO1/2
MTPGEDSRMVTISFDPTEDAKMARAKKTNMLNSFEKKTVSPDAWRFLTGDQASIDRITDLVGFRYKRDENKVDFVHAGTVIFLSPEGKIVRYIGGTRQKIDDESKFSPAELDMAVIDANAGRPRAFMQRMQQICFRYDPKKQGYVLQINRIILGVTLVFAAGFVVYLITKSGVKKRSAKVSMEGSSS